MASVNATDDSSSDYRWFVVYRVRYSHIGKYLLLTYLRVEKKKNVPSAVTRQNNKWYGLVLSRDVSISSSILNSLPIPTIYVFQVRLFNVRPLCITDLLPLVHCIPLIMTTQIETFMNPNVI